MGYTQFSRKEKKTVAGGYMETECETLSEKYDLWVCSKCGKKGDPALNYWDEGSLIVGGWMFVPRYNEHGNMEISCKRCGYTVFEEI